MRTEIGIRNYELEVDKPIVPKLKIVDSEKDQVQLRKE